MPGFSKFGEQMHHAIVCVGFRNHVNHYLPPPLEFDVYKFTSNGFSLIYSGLQQFQKIVLVIVFFSLYVSPKNGFQRLNQGVPCLATIFCFVYSIFSSCQNHTWPLHPSEHQFTVDSLIQPTYPFTSFLFRPLIVSPFVEH